MNWISAFEMASVLASILASITSGRREKGRFQITGSIGGQCFDFDDEFLPPKVAKYFDF
jgi:hypothetical protein